VYTSQENVSVIANVPADAPAGSVIHFDNQGSYLEFEEQVQSVDFLLLDSATGHPIDLNRSAFTVVLSVLTSADDLEMYV